MTPATTNSDYGSLFGLKSFLACYLPYQTCAASSDYRGEQSENFLQPSLPLQNQLEHIFLRNDSIPLTLEECRVFQISHNADRRTARWLKACIPIGLALSFIASLSSIKAYSDWTDGNTVRASLATTVAVGASVLGAFISYVSTGSNPHFASCAANDAQDLYPMITDRFANYAHQLWCLHQSDSEEDQQRATRLATAILDNRLRSAFEELHLNTRKMDLATEPLETVSRVVLGQNQVSYQPSFVSRTILGEKTPIRIITEDSRNSPSQTREYPFMERRHPGNTRIVSLV